MSLLNSLKELYEIGSLSERKQKEYWLISRYQSKISIRLQNRLKVLRREGAAGLHLMLDSLVYKENPFITKITKVK